MRSIERNRVAGAALAVVVCVSAIGARVPNGQAKHRGTGGRVTWIADYVSINGRHITAPTKVQAGDEVRTTGSGQAKVEVNVAKSLCTTAGEDRFIVKPRVNVVLVLKSGDVVCTMLAGRHCKTSLIGGPATIRSCDPVFALIARNGKAIVKVIRGFAVVSGRGRRAGAVLVGRRQQVVVPPRGDPHAPTVATLTTKERKALTVVQAGLPAEHDMTPPTARVVSAPAKATMRGTATFTFAAAEQNVAFACSLDGSLFHPCSSPRSYAKLAPGTHTFSLTATDIAGNTSSVTVYSWVIDRRAPVTTILSQQPVVTSATSATFVFTADESSVRFTCQLDGAAGVPCSSPTTYSGLKSGKHSFTVGATDAAGNAGEPATPVSWTIDLRVPVVTIRSNQPSTTNVASVTFTFSADKNPVTLACQLDSGAVATCLSPKTYTGLTDATHTFVVRATDVAGNVGLTTYTWTVDTTAPKTTLTSTPPSITSATDATFTFTANESKVSFACALDSGSYAPCSTPKSYAGLSPGKHTFAVRATDVAGNAGVAASYTWVAGAIR